MIASQRRAHRLFWLLAAPLLLVLSVWLYLARPATNDPAPTTAAEATP